MAERGLGISLTLLEEQLRLQESEHSQEDSPTPPTIPEAHSSDEEHLEDPLQDTPTQRLEEPEAQCKPGEGS